MKNIFNTIKLNRPKRSTFDLTHDVKFTGNFGDLMPVCVMDCVPGDNVRIGADSLIRFGPLLAPVMHRMDATIHYFFVPNRILWDGWEKFIANDPEAEAHPYIVINNIINSNPRAKRLADLMGVPPFPNTGTQVVAKDVNALPFAAYQAIYDKWYRHQDLIEEVDYKLQGGNNSSKFSILTNLRRRSLEHDYFTASLPFAQKGASVEIPMGAIKNDAEVKFNSELTAAEQITTNVGDVDVSSGIPDTRFGEPNLYAETKGLEVNAGTINEFRLALRLQEWLERNARGGSRYIETILAHFGVRSSDRRLQNPEYITGVKTPIVISEVLNTTGNSGELPQGNMAGHGVGVTTGKLGSYYCEEYGYIIGIMSIMPKTGYMDGLPRHFLRKDFTDYYWPEFAHLGEQEVKNDEIFAYTGTGEETFGYVPRYAEYKYIPSRVAGEFRSSLAYWHLVRKFSGMPTLSQEFVECNQEQLELDRIFATGSQADNMYIHVLNKISANRLMPKYGTPTL